MNLNVSSSCPSRCVIACLTILALICSAQAQVKIETEKSGRELAFRFKSVPSPARNDAAAEAQFTLVDGDADRNGGGLAVLHDGRLPSEEDQPSQNFFFRAGSDGGRLRVDLGRVLDVQRINTYSWHANTRAPQVYHVYGADGAVDGFLAAPKRGTDPAATGWTLLAKVDTRPEEAGTEGGQYGVSVSMEEGGVLGKYRYLLFDIFPTENRDPFGNTFYSEIDVVDANGPTLIPASGREGEGAGEGEPILISFASQDGRYQYEIDATSAPDLQEWAERELRPVVLEWYPKLVAMLPSEGFEASTNLTLRFRNSMGGTPASAGGSRINLNSGWFRRELNREARGSVVHEMVHVVQSYGRARRRNPDATRTPGWLVEGIADYIRWFLYEPETKGAEITQRNLDRAKYDASYRITGNFLNWVTQKHDSEIVRKLNAAAREGRYQESLWEEWTGKTLPDLGAAWKKEQEARLGEVDSKEAVSPSVKL